MSDVIQWSPGVTLGAIERQVIIKAYQHFRNNKTATAHALGISIRTLDTRLEEYEAELKKEQERQNDDSRKRAEWLAKSRGNLPDHFYGYVPPRPEESSPSVPWPEAGMRMEPVTVTAAEPAMPLRERKEIQTLLSPQPPSSGSKRRS